MRIKHKETVFPYTYKCSKSQMHLLHYTIIITLEYEFYIPLSIGL